MCGTICGTIPTTFFGIVPQEKSRGEIRSLKALKEAGHRVSSLQKGMVRVAATATQTK